MKKESLVFIILLLTFPVLLAQNNVLRGIVKLQSSGSQPLDGVEIAGFGANPVYSNSSGMFELRFAGKKAGDQVSLIINKDGYELINEKELEEVVIRSDADEIVIVVMSKQGERNKQALRYYNIILTNTNNNYEKELQGIRTHLQALDEDDEKRRSLYQQIEALNQEREQLIAKAEALANQLAVVDLDQASDMARDAMVLFEQGEIGQAIAALDDQSLAENLQSAQDEMQKAQLRMTQADSAFRQGVENYILKGRLCKMDGQENVALDSYTKAVAADSMNYDNIMEHAEYLSSLHKRDEAIKYFALAKRQARNMRQEVDARLMLAAEQTSNLQYEAAENVLLETVALLSDSTEQIQPPWRKRTTALTFYGLGFTYFKWSKQEQSAQYTNAAINIYDHLVRTTNAEEDIAKSADALSLRAALYSSQRQFEASDSIHQRVLTVYEDLGRRFPGKYDVRLAAIYYNYGLTCSYTDLDKADSMFHRAIAMSEDLNKTQFHYHDVRIANAHWGLARVYSRQGKNTEAENVLNEALKMYTSLAWNRSESFMADVGRTHSMTALVKIDLKKFTEAEDEFHLALEIYKKLALTHGDKFDVEIARVYSNQADLYLITSRFAESEESAKNALAVYPAMESAYATLAPALLYQGKFEEAKAIYLRFKDKEYNYGIPGQTWNTVFLAGLDEFENLGLKHPDMEKIRSLLKQ